jgi:hypothetical protein
MEPVVSMRGDCAPKFIPTLTYGEALQSGKQWDVIWVPAGSCFVLPSSQLRL